MEKLIHELEKQNKEWGEPQTIKSGLETGDAILMLDRKTIRPFSPQMHTFYENVSIWEAGFWGATSFNPSDLPNLYTEPEFIEAISLVAEYYHPLPPSNKADWKRTAIFAKEEGNGLILYWWANEQAVEPVLVSIFGGSIKVFADINEMLRYAALGEFPERGEQVYAALEGERGTLSD